MKGSLKILMVSPEIAPFARTQALGDIGAGLSKSLKESGHDIRVITPQYQVTNERKYVLRDVIRLQNIEVPMGGETVRIHVKSAFIPNSKVQVYFIDYKPFFFREGVYQNPRTRKPYPDNDARFILFAKGVLLTLTKLQWQPDVIHCHDWQSAMVPFFLKRMYSGDTFFGNIFTLLTVHDFSLQGMFDRSCLKLLNLKDESLIESDLCTGGKCGFLKAGIRHADAVNTISESYVKGLQNSPGSIPGMEEMLRAIRNKCMSISNGIDTAEWNPSADGHLDTPYSVNELNGKKEIRKNLLEQFGFAGDESTPLVSVISECEDHHTQDSLHGVLDSIMKMDVRLIIAGHDAESVKTLVKKYGNKVKIRSLGNDSETDQSALHHILAGSDIMLVPWDKPPEGLLPLYGLAYGTVPVARSMGTGGDVISPFNAKSGKGNGFLFKSNAADMVRALKIAVEVFRDPKLWAKVMKNGMRMDLSWKNPARKYVQLYQKCMSRKK